MPVSFSFLYFLPLGGAVPGAFSPWSSLVVVHTWHTPQADAWFLLWPAPHAHLSAGWTERTECGHSALCSATVL